MRVDLQERRQLDMAAQMRRVRAKTRPWRAIISLVIAVAGAIAAEVWGVKGWAAVKGDGHQTQSIIFIAGSTVFLLFGLAAAVGLSGRARSVLQPLIGQAHAGVVRYVLLLVGVFAILLVTLLIGRISVSQLLVGGAVTGVLLGIAAQQSLANLFAGLVLLFARPFRVGDHVRFRSGTLSGQIEGIVTDVSLTYVRLETEDGRVLIPNSQALAAAVLLIPGPVAGSSAPAGSGAPPTSVV
jgi:small-conductance mechanosensitive channel